MNGAAREAALQRSRAYHAAVRQRLGLQTDDPDSKFDYNYRKRAAKSGSVVVEVVKRRVLWERDKGICVLCGLPADPSKWHLEHVLPLSRGGEHSYANTAVSHPRCNLSKGNKTLDEWLAIAK